MNPQIGRVDPDGLGSSKSNPELDGTFRVRLSWPYHDCLLGISTHSGAHQFRSSGLSGMPPESITPTVYFTQKSSGDGELESCRIVAQSKSLASGAIAPAGEVTVWYQAPAIPNLIKPMPGATEYIKLSEERMLTAQKRDLVRLNAHSSNSPLSEGDAKYHRGNEWSWLSSAFDKEKRPWTWILNPFVFDVESHPSMTSFVSVDRDGVKMEQLVMQFLDLLGESSVEAEIQLINANDPKAQARMLGMYKAAFV